jgi:hypothetical protein
MDLRPSLESALSAFALPAVVTPPGGDPVETRAFWLPSTIEQVGVGPEFRRSEARRVLVLPTSEVPQVPRGTIVSMAEYEGGEAREWATDSMERFDSDHHRVWVVPHEQGS